MKVKGFKRLTAFLTVLFIALSLFALDSSLTLGYQQKISSYHTYDPLYMSVNLWQDIGDLRLYGTYTNEMRKSIISWGFSPSQDYFTVGASYTFEQITLRIEHQCAHPVVPYSRYGGIDSGYNKIEITVGDHP